MNEKKIRAALEKLNEDPANEKARDVIQTELAGYTVICRQPDGKIDIGETIEALSFALATGQREIPDCISVDQMFAAKAPTFEADPVTGGPLRKGKTVTKPVVDWSGVSLKRRRVAGYAKLTNQLPHGAAACQSEMVAADLTKPQLEAPWPRLEAEIDAIDAALAKGDRTARDMAEAVDETIIFRGEGQRKPTQPVVHVEHKIPEERVDLASPVAAASIRKIIKDVYRTEGEQDAFFQNYFPGIFGRFSDGMDRDSKITLGIQSAIPDALVRAMQEDRPSGYAAARAKFSDVGSLDLFIYAHPRDRAAADGLMRHCFGIKNRVWNFDCQAGNSYESWVAAKMRAARVVVVVVSADLLCDENTMDMLHAVARSGKRVVPYIAKMCTWKESFFGKVEPLPEEGHLAATALRRILTSIG